MYWHGTPKGFGSLEEPDLLDAIRNRHFAVRMDIKPETITRADLADRLIGFVERSRPMMDWITKIEGRIPASE